MSADDTVTVTFTLEQAEGAVHELPDPHPCNGRAGQARGKLETALAKRRREILHQGLRLPWTVIDHGDDNWCVRNHLGEHLTYCIDRSVAHLIAASPELAVALEDFLVKGETPSTDKNAVNALKKARRRK